MADDFVSRHCEGETCRCGEPAARKVEEVIFRDDPNPVRHELTAYVCMGCFNRIMRPYAKDPVAGMHPVPTCLTPDGQRVLIRPKGGSTSMTAADARELAVKLESMADKVERTDAD